MTVESQMCHTGSTIFFSMNYFDSSNKPFSLVQLIRRRPGCEPRCNDVAAAALKLIEPSKIFQFTVLSFLYKKKPSVCRIRLSFNEINYLAMLRTDAPKNIMVYGSDDICVTLSNEF